MDLDTVTDADIRQAKGGWLSARPSGRRDGVEYAFYLNLVRGQASQVVAAFRAERAEQTGKPVPD